MHAEIIDKENILTFVTWFVENSIFNGQKHYIVPTAKALHSLPHVHRTFFFHSRLVAVNVIFMIFIISYLVAFNCWFFGNAISAMNDWRGASTLHQCEWLTKAIYLWFNAMRFWSQQDRSEKVQQSYQRWTNPLPIVDRLRICRLI